MTKNRTKDPKDQKIGELEDELKRRDERIAELRDEIDELRASHHRMREHAEECDQIIEEWCETFDMEMTESGGWTWKRFGKSTAR